MRKFILAPLLCLLMAIVLWTGAGASNLYPKISKNFRQDPLDWQYFDGTSSDGVREHLARMMSPTILHVDGHTITTRLALTTHEHRISAEIDFIEENGFWSLPSNSCPGGKCTVTMVLDDETPHEITAFLSKQMGLSIFLPKPNELVVDLTKSNSITITTDVIGPDPATFVFYVKGLVWPGVNQ